jgi:hypothetical protein
MALSTDSDLPDLDDFSTLDEFVEHFGVYQVNDGIEALRAHVRDSQESAFLPSAQQVQVVVDSVLRAEPIDGVLTSTGFSEDQLGDVISKLGTHLAQSAGKAGVEEEPTYTSQLNQRPLFQAALPPVGKRSQNVYTGTIRRTKRNPIGADQWLVDESWQKFFGARPVIASYRTIISAQPSEEKVFSFVATKYPPVVFELTLVHIQALRAMTTGKHTIDPETFVDEFYSLQFNWAMVQAYDLLESGRSTATDAFGRFVANPDEPLEDPVGTLVAMQPMYPTREVDDWIRLAELGSDDAITALDVKRRWVRREATANPESFVARHIGNGEMTNTQAHALANASGIFSETASTKQQVSEELKARGITPNAELLAVGERAIRDGRTPEMYDAFDGYAEGDPSWRDALDDKVDESVNDFAELSEI